MFELVLAVGLVCSSALWGFRMWLDRIHPVQPKEAVLDQEWEIRFQKLKETVDELTFGRELRGRGRERE